MPECRDAMDAPFMHLAVAGKAQVLISGDRDLLAIANAFEQINGCPILGLEALVKQYPDAQWPSQ